MVKGHVNNKGHTMVTAIKDLISYELHWQPNVVVGLVSPVRIVEVCANWHKHSQTLTNTHGYKTSTFVCLVLHYLYPYQVFCANHYSIKIFYFIRKSIVLLRACNTKQAFF